MEHTKNNDHSNVVDLSAYRIRRGKFLPNSKDVTQWPEWKIKMALKMGYHPSIFKRKN